MRKKKTQSAASEKERLVNIFMTSPMKSWPSSLLADVQYACRVHGMSSEVIHDEVEKWVANNLEAAHLWVNHKRP